VTFVYIQYWTNWRSEHSGDCEWTLLSNCVSVVVKIGGKEYDFGLK